MTHGAFVDLEFDPFLPALARIAAALATFVAAATLPLPARAAGAVDTVAGMPPVSDPTNLYSDAGAGKLSDGHARARWRASTCPTCARTTST